ncbi:TPA: fimbrial protein [Providencia alcalifaciens]
MTNKVSMMKIKQLFAVIGMMMFSFDALSVGFYTIRVNNLTITNSDQAAQKGTVLGMGWVVYTPGYGEEVCEAVSPSRYSYNTNHAGKYVGMSISNESERYNVFKTNIDGIGYAMSVRQVGTSKWNPLSSGSSSLFEVASDTKELKLEAKFAYVKTIDGAINAQNVPAIALNETAIYCSNTTNGWISSLGYIRLNSGGAPTVDDRTCDIRTPTRQIVNLGIHNQSEIKTLNVGDTFGSAQQSMTIECPSKMTVYYAVTDNNNPETIGKDVILLENESEKPGFGVKMYEAGNSTALKMGGDRDLSGQYQYLFIKTSNTEEVATKVFDFKYVKTSQDVKAVDGNAQVTLTLMYK